MTEIKLTQYSHASGCGCKIAPAVLQKILEASRSVSHSKNILVGNETGDDAAVYDLGNGTALISTTDFFMPIVDNAFDFGRIAAANAISDVYAMGGKPIMALAILGWPIDKLPIEICQQVLAGANQVCSNAGISISGGHTVDSTEPVFGLAVNGLIDIENIKQNNTAIEGDLIYLTKPIGSGILSAALKRKLIDATQMKEAIDWMTTLNDFGMYASEKSFVHAMTDVTGFGLLGHLLEMTEASKLTAIINYTSIQLMEGVKPLAEKFVSPDNTFRNWNAYETKTNTLSAEALIVMCDPQTSGGLLIAVHPEHKNEFENLMIENALEKFASPIGIMKNRESKLVVVQ